MRPAALVLFFILTLLAGIQATSAQVAVSGGTLTGLDGDFVNANSDFGPGGTRFQDGGDADDSCAATLDMGAYRWVNQITVLNRNVASGGQMMNLYAAVSVNQTAPMNLSGYNMSMNAGGSGGPSPVTADASVSRTLNLSRPVYRRYLGLTGITSLSWGNGIADIGDLNVAGSAPTAHSLGNGLTVMAQAGTDTIANIGELGAATSFQALSDGGDNRIYLLLDLGAATSVTGLEFINRQNVATSLNVGYLRVWGAANETAPGFDPQLATSFTVPLAEGSPLPEVTTAGASRRVSFWQGSSRRYLLLEVTGNLLGEFGSGSAGQNAQIGDINVTTTPLSAGVLRFEAENLLQNPGVLGSSLNATNNLYELYSGWGGGQPVLAIHQNETPAAGNVPHLRISGLLPNTVYSVRARLGYGDNADAFSLTYSYSSAADAVATGTAAQLNQAANFPTDDGAGFSWWTLNDASSDSSGQINLYLGAKGNTGSYTGWDKIEIAPVPAPTFVWSAGNPNQTVTQLAPGILHTSFSVSSPRLMAINAVRVDFANPDIRLHTTGRSASWGSPFSSSGTSYVVRTTRQRTADFLTTSRSQGMNMVLAVNGSPWLPFPSSSLSADQLGLLVSGGTLVSPGRSTPSLIFRKDWTLEMRSTAEGADISQILAAVSGFQFVLTSGGVVTVPWTNPQPRTGYGLSRDGRYLVLMTIDGRQPGYSDGASHYEVATWLRELGAWQGINMDGGGSTTMVRYNTSNNSTTTLNRPSDSPARQVASNVGIYYISSPEPVSFTDWLAARGVPAGQSAAGADPDADGVSNLFAYATAVHPLNGVRPDDTFGRQPRFVMEQGTGTTLRLSWRRNRHATGLDLWPEYTTSLMSNSWVPFPAESIQPLGPDPLTGDPRFEAVADPGSADRLFLRLRATLTSP